MKAANEHLNDDNNYVTDSDIEDPKYVPLNVLYKKDTSQQQQQQSKQQQQQQSTNFTEVLQDKIKLIKQEKQLHTQLLKETEIEKQKLLHEITSLTERITAKDCLIAEFQAHVVSSKQKFVQLDKENTMYKTENISLNEQLSQYKALLKQREDELTKTEDIKRNIMLYKQQLKEMEHSYNEKEKKLLSKYKEKETEMKNEYEDDVSKAKREKDSLMQENDKLKHDIITMKSNINSLIKDNDDKQFAYTTEVAKLKKENKKLIDEVNDAKSEVNTCEQQFMLFKTQSNNTIDSLEKTNKELMDELYNKDEYIKELQESLNALNQNVNALTQQDQQSKFNINNKEQIITQLKKQIKQYEETITAKDQHILTLEQTHQQAYNNYCDEINKLVVDKQKLMKDNDELRTNLEMTTAQYKKLQDTFHTKFTQLNTLYKNESTKNKNKETHYNEIIRQMKLKEKTIANENKNLKDIIKTKDKELRTQEMYVRGNGCNSYLYKAGGVGDYSCLNSTYDKIVMNKNILSRNNNMLKCNTNTNTNTRCSGVVNTFGESNVDEEQKKSLEEFKRLLVKMDEKLDTTNAAKEMKIEE